MSSDAALAGTTPYQVGSGRLWIPAALDGVDASGSQLLGSYDYPHDGDDPVTQDRHVHQRHRRRRHARPRCRPRRARRAVFDLLDLVGRPGARARAWHRDRDVHRGRGRPARHRPVHRRGRRHRPGHRRHASAPRPRWSRSPSGTTSTSPCSTVRERPPTGRSRSTGTAPDYVIDLPVDPSTGAVPTQRLEPGVYVAMAFLKVAGVGGDGSKGVALVGNPHLVIDGSDTSIVLDARTANPITLRTPKESEPSLPAPPVLPRLRHRRAVRLVQRGLPGTGGRRLDVRGADGPGRRRSVRLRRPLAHGSSRCSTWSPRPRAAP